MSFFGKILSKLGIGEAEASPPAATTPARPEVIIVDPARPLPPPPSPPPVRRDREVDVVAELEKRAAANPQRLNWKTSIVDLLKLLDIDSSLPARRELAAELGCPPESMGDSAKMNIWLHRAVLARIAENGGNVPPDLLD